MATGRIRAGQVVFVAGIAVAAIVGLALFNLNHFGSFEEVTEARCTPVVGVPGVEDAVADRAGGLAWLSSFDRQALNNAQDEAIRGAIIAFDPDNPLAVSSWKDRTGGVPKEFEPLGIDIYSTGGQGGGAGGQTSRLFVINKADASVLVYSITGTGELALINTLRDARLTSPNSIIATGPRSFYVTNSSPWRHGSMLSSVDFVSRQANGSIFYYDGNSWSESARGLHFANGLALNADGTRLYVAESSAKRIRVYERDQETGILRPERTIALGQFPDNLVLLDNGTLLAGAIPQPLSFAAHASGRQETSPSLLLAVNPEAGTVARVFADDGSRLSGLTVGTSIAGKLLLGAFAENKFLLCDSPDPTE